MFATFAVLALAASTALAAPQPRDVTPQCLPLGGGSFSDGGPYALHALNATQNNQLLGVPLVTNPSGAGENTFRQLIVGTPDQKSDFPTWNLRQSRLTATNQGRSGLAALASPVGTPAQFQVFGPNAPIASDPVFCALVGTSAAGGNPKYPGLHRSDSSSTQFSLCETKYRDGETFNTIVFGASAAGAATGNYDFASCYEVSIQLVQS